MEVQKEANEKQRPKKDEVKKTMSLKKIDPETAKVLNQFKEKANKKTYGRKVRDGEIIALALKQLNASHLHELQQATLSQKDKLHMAHEEFCKQHGKVSLDQFIGRLLQGEIRTS